MLQIGEWWFQRSEISNSYCFFSKDFKLKKKNVTAIEPCKESLDIDAKECAEATVAMEEEENTAW